MIDDKNLENIDLTEEDNQTLPEWEKALSEYAHETAPDLLPGILAKINTAPPKQDDAERLRKYRRLRMIKRASAAAAAVLVLGILLYAVTKIPKTKNEKDLKLDTATPTVTVAQTDQGIDAPVTDRPANSVDPANINDERQPDSTVPVAEPTDSVVHSDPFPTPVSVDDTPRLGTQYKMVLKPADIVTDTLSGLPEELSSNYKYYREQEAVAARSLSDSGGTLENVIAIRVGNATSDTAISKCVYRIFTEGCDLSDVLFLSSEDFMYRVYQTLTVVPAGTSEDDGTTYRLFEETDETP